MARTCVILQPSYLPWRGFFDQVRQADVFVHFDDVQYDKRALSERVRRTIEGALRAGRISLEDSALLRKRYDQGLNDYTYLSDEG